MPGMQDLPVSITLLLSMGSGLTVSMEGTKLLFKNADDIQIRQVELEGRQLEDIRTALDDVENLSLNGKPVGIADVEVPEIPEGVADAAVVGKNLETAGIIPDGSVTKPDVVEDNVENMLEAVAEDVIPRSFAEMMSPEDAARYLHFLKNGSTAGLTSAERAAIEKVDELLALKKINYQDILDMRSRIVESGSKSLIDIDEIRPKLKTEPDTAFF